MATTTVELVEELKKRNSNGKYNSIIARAEQNGYHDFKMDYNQYPKCLCPKMDLERDLSRFPELNDLRQRVIEGDFDEPADESDKENLRQSLLANGEENLIPILGL